jgi:hypothetical protein
MRTSSPQLVSSDAEPTGLPPALNTVVMEELFDAKALERKGHGVEATSLIAFADRIMRAVSGFAMLPESEATVFGGLKPRALRARYQELERRGLAFTEGKTRFCCEAALRHNATLVRAHAEGRAAATGAPHDQPVARDIDGTVRTRRREVQGIRQGADARRPTEVA